MTPLSPSGQQVELSFGTQRAVVVEVGGGLRSYSVGGVEVLDGYGVEEICTSGRGQCLIPWPNRLDAGVYDFDGEQYQLPLTEPPKRTAIHGLTRFANWIVADQGSDHAEMRYRLHPQPGYPFLLDLALTYRLDKEGLSVTCRATNRSDRPCPYGSGAHPYVCLDGGSIDSLDLTSPATEVLLADARGIPTGRAPVERTGWDFQAPRRLAGVQLDTAFTGLLRDAAGHAVVAVSSAQGGGRAEVWLGEGYGYVMLFTGDTLSPERRRRGLAVEPMTCAPNAFRSGDGLIRLVPGESTAATWGMRAML